MPKQGVTSIDIDFDKNPSWDEHYDHSVGAIAAKTEAAEKSKGIAQLIAPKRTGHYAASFVIARNRGDILLGNKDFKANWIEWGTVGTPRLNIPPFPAHAVLRRATRAAGYRLIENPRH